MGVAQQEIPRGLPESNMNHSSQLQKQHGLQDELQRLTSELFPPKDSPKTNGSTRSQKRKVSKNQNVGRASKSARSSSNEADKRRVHMITSQYRPAVYPPTQDLPTPLHYLCHRKDTSVKEVQLVLEADRSALSTSACLYYISNPMYYPRNPKVRVIKKVREPFTYPLHLAIKNKLSDDVIKTLIAEAPEILMAKDGMQRSTPLHVLLKYKPPTKDDHDLFDFMLAKFPEALTMLDRHDETPLHVACRSGITKGLIERLIKMCPEAIVIRNFHGKAPHEVAGWRTSIGSDRLCSFLRNEFNKWSRLVHIVVDHEPNSN